MEFIKKEKGIEDIKIGDILRKPTYLNPGGDAIIDIKLETVLYGTNTMGPKYTLTVSGWDGDYMLVGRFGTVVEVYVEAA